MNKTFLSLVIISIITINFSFAFQTSKAKKFAKTITEKELSEHLYTYASDEFEGRDTGAPGQKKAVEYIRNYYKSIGIEPGDLEGDYFQEMTLTMRGRRGQKPKTVETENVIAIIRGSEKPDEYVVITAHLDHVGITDGEIYNGADDDGSGTVALLEIAEAFQKAVKELNSTLLEVHYGVKKWIFPDENLCPPIPGRVDYMHYISDLLSDSNCTEKITILDIGTGASCIYPLLGVKEYDWDFVATDIELDSLDTAQDIIDDNNLSNKIILRQQFDEGNILEGIIEKGDSFSAVICNPPFYKSEKEARGANARKNRNLGTNTVRNFSGNNNELWYPGGEKAFLHNYLYQSSLFKNSSLWFTSLVSKKDTIESLQKSGVKLNVKTMKIIPMHQGNKVTRIIAWQF